MCFRGEIQTTQICWMQDNLLFSSLSVYLFLMLKCKPWHMFLVLCAANLLRTRLKMNRNILCFWKYGITQISEVGFCLKCLKCWNNKQVNKQRNYFFQFKHYFISFINACPNKHLFKDFKIGACFKRNGTKKTLLKITIMMFIKQNKFNEKFSIKKHKNHSQILASPSSLVLKSTFRM